MGMVSCLFAWWYKDQKLEESTISVMSSVPLKQPSKKRRHEEMLDANLLAEMLNRTFSDDDDLDSTFMISKCEELSSSESSNGHSLSEEYRSPIKASISDPEALQDTLPMASANESEQHEQNMSSKSNEVTFESTVGDTDEQAVATNEDDSTTSVNEENRTKIKTNGKQSNGSTNGLAEHLSNGSNGTQQASKESLNLSVDPVDSLMSTLVAMDKTGKKNNRKKRNYSSSMSQESVNRQKSGNKTRSQEAIDKLL